jgi:hypothetical protein
MNKLISLIESLKTFVPNATLVNEKISASSIGWHIDHSLLVVSQIIKAMEASDPAQYQYQFNIKRILAFTFNKFPRGVAKAPKAVRPEEIVDINKTMLAFDALNKQLNVLAQLQPNQFFVHPFFGKLNKKAAEKMMTIHTNHHILIIKDILQKQA